jgi:hypothetical protein
MQIYLGENTEDILLVDDDNNNPDVRSYQI